MKKSIVMVIALVSMLLIIAGCTQSATGSVPSAPPAPSGGGCGIAAPAPLVIDGTSSVDRVDASTAA